MRNKVLNRSKMLLLLTVVIQAGLWVVVLKLPDCAETMHTLLIIFAVLTVLFVIPVWGMNLFAKGFDTYYKQLSDWEKQQFEEELKQLYKGQKVIITSKAVVTVNFIVIKAFPISQIMSMRLTKVGRGKGWILYFNGQEGILDVTRDPCQDKMKAIMQAIQDKNEYVLVEK